MICKTTLHRTSSLFLGLLLSSSLWNLFASAQSQAWFVDGYHGGMHGHYPATFTQFVVESLERHPEWKVNLEIEPETWDFAVKNTPEDFARFKMLAQDQSADGRIEFVNPAYGQAYLWNISGESIIQQLDRGIAKLREHFPNAGLTTYCSEEPCFTSALPGILKSFGFQHAVLKNPNTCWGGYMRAFGGELVNWVGPDGACIVTVPRYDIEALSTERTWETIGNANAPEYIRVALAAGIQHPVGMCLQDAGWRNGPWLGDGRRAYQPTKYTTWRNYFERVATNAPAQDWHFSQEDVQVSLVWGAQVLQRIAQQVRAAENRLAVAEKMATMAGVLQGAAWPERELDEAWPALLLAQHHDCWIVPYNGGQSNTWADKVARWTKTTLKNSDDIILRAAEALTPQSTNAMPTAVRVFNTLAVARRELVTVPVPSPWSNSLVRVLDSRGVESPSQRVSGNSSQIVFCASVPAMGFETYQLELGAIGDTKGASAASDSNGVVRVETDLYRIEVDPKHGGTIRSWIVKRLGGQELVDARAERKLNEIRGYFFDQKRFLSTTDKRATIEIIEAGPVRVRLQINSEVATNQVTQWITLVDGEPRVDFQVKIDWQNQPRIGSNFEQGKALTLQYAGIGLWGRDYTVRGPTEIRYALVPHAGDAAIAGIWEQGNAWCEPLLVQSQAKTRDASSGSLLSFDRPGWEVPTMRRSSTNVTIRLFNSSKDAAERTLYYGAPAAKVELVELDGRVIKQLEMQKSRNNETTFKLAMPQFGVSTLHITP